MATSDCSTKDKVKAGLNVCTNGTLPWWCISPRISLCILKKKYTKTTHQGFDQKAENHIQESFVQQNITEPFPCHWCSTVRAVIKWHTFICISWRRKKTNFTVKFYNGNMNPVLKAQRQTNTWVNLLRKERGRPLRPPPWFSGFWQAKMRVRSCWMWKVRASSGTNTSPRWSRQALRPSSTDWEARFIWNTAKQTNQSGTWTLHSTDRERPVSYTHLRAHET